MERTEFWHTLHSKAFPLAISIEKEHDIARQKLGIDRIITFPWGTLDIEEKLVASRHVRTMAFETVSHVTYGVEVPGWAEKPQLSKVFCYAHEKTGLATYFNTSALFACWILHKAEWINTYRERPVANSKSKVVPVPLSVLHEALPKHHKVFRTDPLVITPTIDLSARFHAFTHGAIA